MFELAPRVSRANTFSAPPLIDVLVMLARSLLVVQHGANSAPEVRVDEFTGAFPPEVRIVEIVIGVETMQILGQFTRRFKFVDVNVRTIRRAASVVCWVCSHHYGQYVVPEIFYKMSLNSSLWKIFFNY